METGGSTREMNALFRPAFAVGALIFAVAAALPASAAIAGTLKTVRDRGALICGVSNGLPGFSVVDDKGEWSGFDVDFCRAVAAAIFGDSTKARFVPVLANERFDVLKAKKVDLLLGNSTWTMSREATLNLVFAGTTYYDGQGFLAPKRRNLLSALELDGSKVCVEAGTTSELNFVDYFQSNNLKYEALRFKTVGESVAAYEAGQCDVLTSDVSELYAQRLLLAKPGDHVILADIISKEPLGPVVRQDDMQWLNIVKWVHFAMLNAEELGISSKTVGEALNSNKPAIRRFVGAEGDFARQLGLSPDWGVNIVRSVGNYGEVLDRNLGAKSLLGIDRGLNQLWSVGGIQYAPPIR